MDDTTCRGRARYLALLEAQAPWQRLAQAVARPHGGGSGPCRTRTDGRGRGRRDRRRVDAFADELGADAGLQAWGARLGSSALLAKARAEAAGSEA